MEVKERSEIQQQYKWDLTSLFESDEKWEEKLSSLKGQQQVALSYQGKLDNAQTIYQYLKWDYSITSDLSDLFCYASLRHSEDTRDSSATSMYSRIYSLYVEISSASAFARPEILSLDDDKLKAIIEDYQLKDYRFMLEDLYREKKHTLSAKEEIVISSFGESFAAASEISESLRDSDLTFDDITDDEGKKYPLSESSYIHYQMSDDRTLRKSAFESYYKTYKQHIHTFASAYRAQVKTAVTEARLRGYGSSREMSLSKNNIPLSVYDNLIESVHRHLNLMYRYLAIRKKLLSVDELHYYDVYAPLSKGSNKQYTYKQAQQMVLEAVSPLGKEYQKKVQQAFDEKWVDVYPNVGKSNGAYSSGTYHSNPYIMMNFNGSLDSVSTLAHEMGHSLHTYLTNSHQPVQYSDYSLFVAEVASTVNENLLIDQLLQNCNDPRERLALLNEYLEGFKGTVYRQTMFAEFEMKAHQMAQQGQSLDCDSLSEVYENLIKLYFGDELVIDPEVKYEWARIPHFFNPFYVYVYATGYTSAVAIKEGILKQGQSAVDRYLEFLSMGSSDYPLNELKHAGVDLTSSESIDRAFEKLEEILDDAEKTIELL
ncbi:MAG: oligoendopeptidase F [Erysipelotrichaceae bacterium]|nr:oligoendopeptidase F [Erysipelotrichaceae bacterium]